MAEATSNTVLRRLDALVLLTRGMIGTILYSVDDETQEFLAGLIG